MVGAFVGPAIRHAPDISWGLTGAAPAIAGSVVGCAVGALFAVVSLVKVERPGWLAGVALTINLLVVGLVGLLFAVW